MSTRRHEDANPVGFLRYCLDEAWTAIRRRWRVAMLSTALIAAAVFVVGAALGASEALRDVTTRMTEAAELSVYLAREATAADRERAARITREDAAVAAAEVLDEAQATARVTSDFPDLAAVITALPERPFGAVVEARLAATATEAQVEALVARLRAAPGVEDVIYDRDVLRRVLVTVTTVRRVVTGLAALLALAAFAAVAAVLRLGYYARREEIAVLGLIGAPTRAISGPFVAEGLLQAAAGTVIALVVLRAAVWAVLQGPAAAWARALEVTGAPFLSWQHLLTLASVAILAGGLAGWVGSRQIDR
ncbi:cell division protein FtsX [Luteitalea sp.]|jgi:cell division transport system permease protein|uniref:cell division protein FtsX n=1 Tax=Luteitalea sp. TaxID=2004800 RepID=UPI0037CA27C2